MSGRKEKAGGRARSKLLSPAIVELPNTEKQLLRVWIAQRRLHRVFELLNAEERLLRAAEDAHDAAESVIARLFGDEPKKPAGGAQGLYRSRVVLAKRPKPAGGR